MQTMCYKCLTALALALCLMAAGGCDFLRKVAGRPTSEDLAVLSQQAREREQEAAAARDSAAAAREASMRARARQDDSLSAVRALQDGTLAVTPLSKLGNLPVGTPSARYSVVLGAFSSEENVRRLSSKVSDAGYSVETLAYRNGTKAVLAACTDDIVEFSGSLRRLVSEPFCPPDAWILVNGL